MRLALEKEVVPDPEVFSVAAEQPVAAPETRSENTEFQARGRLDSQSGRNLCAACPPNVPLLSSISAGRHNSQPLYCCPARLTVTSTKVVIVRTLTKTALRRRTQTVTKVKPFIVANNNQTVRVKLFRDINSNGVFDVTVDLPIARSAVRLVKFVSTRGSYLVLAEGITGADGSVAFVSDNILAGDGLLIMFLANSTILAKIQIGADGKVPSTTIPLMIESRTSSTINAMTSTVIDARMTSTVTKLVMTTTRAVISSDTMTTSSTRPETRYSTTKTLVCPQRNINLAGQSNLSPFFCRRGLLRKRRPRRFRFVSSVWRGSSRTNFLPHSGANGDVSYRNSDIGNVADSGLYPVTARSA